MEKATRARLVERGEALFRASFQLWQSGETIAHVSRQPKLASWDAAMHPKQRALQEYLNELEEEIGPLPSNGLSLSISVGVKDERQLLLNYDLENYLTPIAKRFGHQRFVHATAVKSIDGNDHIRICHAIPIHLEFAGWGTFVCSMEGSTQKPGWKEGLSGKLAAFEQLPEGPVEVHLAWRCEPRRDWVSLWKPTGDCMGSILGYPLRFARNRRFDPLDDRITRLHFHLTRDSSLKKTNLEVGMCWRSL